MKKKCLSILLVLSLLVSALSISALAVGETAGNVLEPVELTKEFLVDADISIEGDVVTAKRTTQLTDSSYRADMVIVVPTEDISVTDLYMQLTDTSEQNISLAGCGIGSWPGASVSASVSCYYTESLPSWNTTTAFAAKLTQASYRITIHNSSVSVSNRVFSYSCNGQDAANQGSYITNQLVTKSVSANSGTYNAPSNWRPAVCSPSVGTVGVRLQCSYTGGVIDVSWYVSSEF